MSDITQASVQTAKLNQGQEQVADAFFQFLFSDEKEMGISGPGGVGKSFLVSHLIDEVMPRYEDTCGLMGIKPQYDDVAVTAMTNKASEVLSTATGRPVPTIHSFMNLKVQEDYSTGQSKIAPTGAWKIHERKIIFIDECSMFEHQLDRYVQDGTQNTKIVYVGDHCQLRSVGGINPLYQPNRMKWYELTEQMRTQVPEIQALHTQLRRTVETGVFEPIQIVPGLIDHLDDQQMQAELANTFTAQTLNSRILGYTNKRVVAYNDYIRGLRGLPVEYTLGEFLVNNNAVRLKGQMLRVEEEVELIGLGPVDKAWIGGEVEMAFRKATIRTRSGGTFNDVPLPVDRAHFSALVNHFRKAKKWPVYYDLRNTYPELRQRDAATAYKAQGSTYDTGFIDLGDISTCHNPDQVARMLYVALSRERHRIMLFGTLADKYGGLRR